MKKLVIVIFLLLFSCSKNEQEDCFFRIDSSEVTLSWKYCMKSIAVETNVKWSIEQLSDAEWIVVEKMSENGLRIQAFPNETSAERSVDVILSTEIGIYHLHISQSPSPELMIVGDKEIFVSNEKTGIKVRVVRNVDMEKTFINDGESWIKQRINISAIKLSDTVYFDVMENESMRSRSAGIIFYNIEHDLYDTLKVIQSGNVKDKGTWEDGDWLCLNNATKGDVNLIIMGDGFTSDHLKRDGVYEKVIKDACNHFFSIEPYKNYKDYFNVYVVFAESKNEGVGDKNSGGLDDFENKFGSAFGDGTEIICNSDEVFEYARKVDMIDENEVITVIVVLNSVEYAGTAYMFSDGNTIALCPMSNEAPPNDFEGIIHHEAGGHAFGLLCDEYVYNEVEIPEERKLSIQQWQKKGFYLNLDFTGDVSKILWKDFIGLEKYSNVWAYEGGYEYRYGVWRCEENSCMNNNIPYYNAQSRWRIVKRIMQLSGKQYSVQDFINDDIIPQRSDTKLSQLNVLPPLGRPVMVCR